RVLVAADLLPRIDLLARLARRRVGGAEPGVVVDDAREAGVAEDLGVLVDVHLLDGREPVGHDDARHLAARVVGPVEPPAQRDAVGVELDVLAHFALLSIDGRERAYAPRTRRDEKIPAERETPRRPLSGGAPGRVRYRDFDQPVKCGCTACVGRAQVRNDMFSVRAGPAPERNCTRARTRWIPTRRRRGSTGAVYSPALDARATLATRRPSTKNVTRRIWRPRTRRVTGLAIGQARTAARRADPRRTSTPLTAPAGAGGVA